MQAPQPHEQPMVDYAPPWDALPRDSLHAPHEMPLSQVRNTASSLAALLDENKEEQVLKEACLGLCQLFGEGIQNDRIQAILEANVVPKLVALLRPTKNRQVPLSVQSAALQVLGNVACGDDRQTQVVIDSNALPCLRSLLSSSDRNIRKEVCWIVSNITESSHQVQDVLDADILPPLLKLLDNQDSACREDATWVLFNLSSNRDPRQIAYLAEKNGVRALCNLLTCSKELDVLWKGCGTVAAVALKGLRNILISGQIAAASDPNGYNKMASLVAEAHGVERIEALTTHVSLDVRTRARLLLERMFGAEPTTADLSPPLPPPSVTGLSSLTSPAPTSLLGHAGCSCACQQQHHHHHNHQYQASTMYDVSAMSAHSALSQSSQFNHSLGVEAALPNHLHPEGDLIEVPGSTSGSSTDSDPEDDDSDSDLIPPPPAPCKCVLCSDPSPLAEKRPRWKSSFDDPDFHKKNGSQDGRSEDIRNFCHFCSGGGRLGDGRAGLAAKLGRAVRLGHPHCLAILLSRMTWSQRAAATEAPALLHPGGGPPDGGVGSSLPAVILAAQLGKPECLGLLLRRCKPDLDVTHGKKRLTALAWAAHKGYMRCCQLLIEHGANPATKCGDGVTALHLAASGGGHIAICKLLIDHNAPVNARSSQKQTPLCLAAQKGFVKVVQLLLDHGADPNNEDEQKYTPLHLASSNGFVSSVDLLLKAGARVDATTRKGITPLHYAVQGVHAAVVKLLISSGASVNCNRKPLLLIAADDGNLEIVQILLDANAEVDCKANITAHLDKDTEFNDYLTPLHLAASKNHQEVVDLLLRRGANVNELTSKSLWSALDLAVLNGHAECSVLLLQHGSLVTDKCKAVGDKNWSLVQYACKYGAKDVARLLVQRVMEQGTNVLTGAESPLTSNTNTVKDRQSDPQASSGGASLPNGFAHEHHDVSPSSTMHCQHGEGLDHDDLCCSDAIEQTLCNHEHHAQIESQTSIGTDFRSDRRASEIDETGYSPNSSTKNAPGPQENAIKNGASRRRIVKEDRQNNARSRELRKREQEASEARERLDEAVSQRSVAKLTEAIAHVSKLVLHLATAVGGDMATGSGHMDYNDVNGYGVHADPYSHTGHVHGSGGKHGTTSSTASTMTAPLPMEVGLGNEVQKARKILAGLLAEEKRAKEEKEREVADSRRENAQQTVKKATISALEGGDPRSLSRAINRATRTILEMQDPFVMEASNASKLISGLEKWEGSMKTAVSEKSLDKLSKALPEAERALTDLLDINGEGAAQRVFGGADPQTSLANARELLDKLQKEKESQIAKEAAARDLENAARIQLDGAISSNNIAELESALNAANSALISKGSELASAIESGKKLLAKCLKGERRKLRQANNSNDPQIIENAAARAEGFGLQALQGDIDTANALAQKLRDQADAARRLEDAIKSSDVSALTEIRGKLNRLGMFADAERAREEMERLQRATRARTLLEGAVKENVEHRDPILTALNNKSAASDILSLLSDWAWPDAQRLYDLSARARKYGQALHSLCDSADQLARELAVLGRRILFLMKQSNDATAIASAIAGYEKSFVNVSKSDVFDKEASGKAIANAKLRLAEVQAMDQASVKAESAQVKVEYALATSRRSAARSRGTRGGVKTQQGSAAGTTNLSPAPRGRGAVGSESRSPSSPISDPVEDESSSTETGLSGLMQGEGSTSSRGTEGKFPAEKRTRSAYQADDSGLFDNLDEGSAASAEECSHFYLFKEGTTVCCARCGHLRSSSNPEWLARVKRRGNKVPPDLVATTLPHVSSGNDLHSPLHASSQNVQGRSPSSKGYPYPYERSSGRSAGGPIEVHPHLQSSPGIAGNGMIPGRENSRIAGTSGMAAGTNPGVSMMMKLLQHQHQSLPQKNAASQPTGRGRPQGSQLPQSLGPHIGGMAGVYREELNRNMMPAVVGTPVSLPLPGNFASPGVMGAMPGMASGQPALRYGVVNPAVPLRHVDGKNGLGVNVGQEMAKGVGYSLGLEPLSMTHHGERQGIAGLSQAMNGRPLPGDEVGGSGMDLGVDFANENFGFDISAIVDDNPPPRPSKTIGTREGDSRPDVGKMFSPDSRAQRNGFFRR